MEKIVKEIAGKIFGKSKSLPSKIVNAKTQWNELINYYPPDISVHKLAKQDPALKELQLRDKWLDTKLNREIALKNRNKPIRVSGEFKLI
jgi:hypothetical protein